MRQMRSRKPAKRPTRVRLIMLCVGAAFFRIFFLTVLVQAVRGYLALKTGLGYLPLTAGIMGGLRCRGRARPAGRYPLGAAGGPYWLSRLGPACATPVSK
jgi:hypothetical protein